MNSDPELQPSLELPNPDESGYGPTSELASQAPEARVPGAHSPSKEDPSLARRVPEPNLERPRLLVDTPSAESVGRTRYVYLGPIAAIDNHAAADAVRMAPAVQTTPHQQPASSDNSRVEAQLAGLERKIERLTQAQSDRQTSELERAVEALQQMQQSQRMELLERQLQELTSRRVQNPAAGPIETVTSQSNPTAKSRENVPVLQARPSRNDAERFSLQIQDADLTQVLEMLGQLAGLNLLIGKNVTGNVTANLEEVTVEQALDGILRSHGYVAERDEKFLYVMTAADAEARKKSGRKVISKVYRPHYISVNGLKTLIEPLITPGIGKIAITAPSEVGGGSGGTAPVGGLNAGDSLAQRDALVVLDYAEVIQEIDALVAEMDVPPLQVVIEAMILQVTLDDSMALGVNFALLDGSRRNLLVTGSGQQLNSSSAFPGADKKDASLLPAAGSFIGSALGLKYGFINGDISAFVDALEEITDVNVIASPQLRVLNKQQAQLLIGEKLGYNNTTITTTATTSQTQGVEFLEVGTNLILRPNITPDGLIRMKIHPKQSTGEINPTTGIPNERTTELTTDVMVRDGTTIVLGGLITEEVVQQRSRIPFLGSLPLVGHVFGSRSDSVRRSELIVLITPRIVHDPAEAAAGEAVRIENERRHTYFRNHLSPVNRRNLARMYCERARQQFERGDLVRARASIRESLRRSKNSLEALRLRDQIEAAIRGRNGRWLGLPDSSDHADTVVEPLDADPLDGFDDDSVDDLFWQPLSSDSAPPLSDGFDSASADEPGRVLIRQTNATPMTDHSDRSRE